MKAVYIKEFGGTEHLEIRDVPDSAKPANSQVLIRVAAAGLNRADLLQRRGLYPPPPGYSPNIPGLEFAGEVIETGPNVRNRQVGNRVFGITAGEAQAELILIDEALTAPMPKNLCFVEAAAVPEAFVTAHDALFSQAGLSAGETVLIHAVGSGVGLAALQLAKQKNAFTIGTSRSTRKLELCAAFGLDSAINTSQNPHFSDAVLEITGGRGVDVILDLVGGAFFEQNLASLALKGRLMLVGLTGGARTEFDLSRALSRRLRIQGTVLRSRPMQEKAAALQKFMDDCGPLLEKGVLKPNLDRVFPFDHVAEAHRYLEGNENFGKVVLKIGPA